jgi:beta-lactam-binding protein with PASTA domain
MQGAAETVTAQIPQPGQSVPGDSEILLYFGDEPLSRTVTVPDFTDMTRQQASDAAGVLGLYIQVTGNTEITPSVKVVTQSVPKDTKVSAGTTIELLFADSQSN